MNATLPLLAGLLFGGGLAVMIVSIRRRSLRRVRDLRDILEVAYNDPSAAPPSAAGAGRLLARSGALAEKALARAGVMAGVKSRIERSDWDVGPGEFAAASLGAGLLGAIAGMSTGAVPLAVLLGVAGLVAPAVLAARSVEKRRSRFEAQLPDVLDLMAAALEAGAGITQALELVVEEAGDPVASEFGRALGATRVGAPLTESLEEMATRIGSRDLTWTVQAISIQQETGGRLADILHTVAGFMRAREEVRRELSALVAEGKLSAYVLGLLPFFVAGVILLFNPTYLNPLFSSLIGLVMLGGALVLMFFGFWVMSRIVKIEV